MQPLVIGRFLYVKHGLSWPALFSALLTICTASFAETLPAEDLSVVPGPDGFVSTWLELGSIKAPPAIAADSSRLSRWDPLGSESIESRPLLGEKHIGDRWQLTASGSTRTKIEGKRPGVVYLAALVRVETARRVYLSMGSSTGIDVRLNGKQLLFRDQGRRADSDTDLVELDLPAGDSLLVLRTWKKGKGAWSVKTRFLDGEFRRARRLDIVLPAAAGQLEKVFSKGCVLSIDRTVDLDGGGMTAQLWLDFPGGRPVADDRIVRMRWFGPSAPAKGVMTLKMGKDSPSYELLATERFEGAKCPSRVEVRIGNHSFSERLNVRMRDVNDLARAAADLEDTVSADTDIPRTSTETLEWRVDHLRKLVEAGDRDHKYIGREVSRTAKLARSARQGSDPFSGKRGGIQRRGYRSAVDGKLHHYAVYVPNGWRETGTKEFGLVVSLHGLNSNPMKALTSLFGMPLAEGETKKKRERHPGAVGRANMFAVAPEGFGNSGYISYGERDVIEVLERVLERYRIDPRRVYITGASMGGTGAASVPLHYPDKFAAMVPLCGYHSLSVYHSLRNVVMRSWEKRLAEFRSNSSWAANGRHIPLYMVHGTKDGPRYSKVLLEQFKARGYQAKLDMPEAGHNVWDETYADRAIFGHFSKYKIPLHPRKVTLRTARLRYNRSHWLRVDDVDDHSSWAGLDGSWSVDGKVVIETDNARSFTVFRDEKLESKKTLVFEVDGQDVPASEATDGRWTFSRANEQWSASAPQPCGGLCKRPDLAGPMGDAMNEPLLFVYGTVDPAETALARRLIQRMKRPRAGTTVDWPMEADVEVSAEDIERYSLVVVGTPHGNSLLARIADRLPIRVEDGAVLAGKERFAGDTVATSFIYPNPLNTDRYVVVHTAVTSKGLYYTGHLPQLVPDYLIYDGSSWGYKGGLVLKGRPVLKGGFFNSEWEL